MNTLTRPAVRRPGPRPAAPATNYQRPPAPIGPAPATAAPNRILQALKYHWFLLATLGPIAGGSAAAAAWSAMPAKYTSSVLLRVSSGDEDTTLLPDREGMFGRTNFGTYIKTQAQLIRSNYVLTAALRDPKVVALPTFQAEPDPIKWLEQELKIDPAEGSELLKVSLEGTNPDDLKAILNAVVQASYMKEIVEDEQKRKGDKLKLLEDLAKNQQSQLINKKSQLKQGLSSGMGDLVIGTGAIGERRAAEQLFRAEEQLDRLRRDLNGAKMELFRKTKTLERIKDGTLTPEMGPPIPPSVAEQDAYQAMIREAEAIRGRIAYLRDVSTNPNHPDILRRVRRVEELDKKIAEGPPKGKPAEVKNDPVARMRFEQLKLDAEFQGDAVKMMTEQEIALTQRVDQLRDAARDVAKSVEDHADLAKEVTRLERTVDRINEKTNLMRIELKSPAKVKLLQTASAPIRKEGKRQVGMTAAAGLAGFGLIGLMLVGYELRVRRVYAPADLAAVTPAGFAQKVFPVDARKLARSLATPRTGETAPDGADADAACELIARELFDAQARTVLLTGPAREENHGLLAVQLALHLHRTGLRTVLVDCNWAHPEVSAILHASDKPGVAEVLRGDLAVQHAVLRAGANGVYVLPAGRRDAHSAEAAAAGRLTQLLNELQRSYDLVLIDAPAAGMSVDAVVLTRASDTVLMAVEQYRSRLPNLGQALDQLALQGQREVRYAYMA